MLRPYKSLASTTVAARSNASSMEEAPVLTKVGYWAGLIVGCFAAASGGVSGRGVAVMVIVVAAVLGLMIDGFATLADR